jgi:hypothetical protein
MVELNYNLSSYMNPLFRFFYILYSLKTKQLISFINKISSQTLLELSFYNDDRIKTKLKGTSSVNYRKHTFNKIT